MPPPAAWRPAAEPDEQGDEEQSGAEVEEERLPQRAAGAQRLGVDDHALGREQREQVVVAEGRELCLEVAEAVSPDTGALPPACAVVIAFLKMP